MYLQANAFDDLVRITENLKRFTIRGAGVK